MEFIEDYIGILRIDISEAMIILKEQPFFT